MSRRAEDMGPPQQVRDRVRLARARGRLAAFDYLDYDADGNVVACYCKLCGEVMWYTDADGTHITPLYAELTIEFDDGSNHETAMCPHCRDRVQPDMLEDLYAADLERWRDEAERFNAGQAAWHAVAERKPRSLQRQSRAVPNATRRR